MASLYWDAPIHIWACSLTLQYIHWPGLLMISIWTILFSHASLMHATAMIITIVSVWLMISLLRILYNVLLKPLLHDDLLPIMMTNLLLFLYHFFCGLVPQRWNSLWCISTRVPSLFHKPIHLFSPLALFLVLIHSRSFLLPPSPPYPQEEEDIPDLLQLTREETVRLDVLSTNALLLCRSHNTENSMYLENLLL